MGDKKGVRHVVDERLVVLRKLVKHQQGVRAAISRAALVKIWRCKIFLKGTAQYQLMPVPCRLPGDLAKFLMNRMSQSISTLSELGQNVYGSA